MTFKTHQSQIRRLDRGDPRFMIRDRLVVAPRAGFEISRCCPNEYRTILLQALEAGWIKPIAHVHERELLFMGLSNDI